MNFFLEEQLITFSCTYWPFSFCGIFKKFLEPILIIRMYHFQVQNHPIILNKFFLVQTTIITFIYLLALFILQTLKTSYSRSRIMRMYHFQVQNCPIVLNNLFLVQTTIITFIFLLALFILQTLKKSYSRSRIMRMCHCWAQNGLFAPIFFLKKKLLNHFHLPVSPFHCKKLLKNYYSRSKVMRMHHFGPRMAHLPK